MRGDKAGSCDNNSSVAKLNYCWLCFGMVGWEVYLLDQLNTSLKVHTEVNELPVDTFALVLFLFQDKHVVVEELLQFLVGEIDAKLFKSVVLDWCWCECCFSWTGTYFGLVELCLRFGARKFTGLVRFVHPPECAHEEHS